MSSLKYSSIELLKKHKMTENMPSYFMQQSISIPFCWEEVPGTPKKDWKKKPTTSQEDKSSNHPAKFIVSIPFKWEEKPGTPLPYFSQPENTGYFLSYPKRCSLVNDTYWHRINEQDSNETEISDAYSDIWESSIEGSFSSIPLLDTRPGAPNAVTMQPRNQEVLKDAWQETPDSPSSESDSKRYDTGASLLEWLFPLLSPHSSYLEKVGCREKGIHKIQPMDETNDFYEKNNTAEIKTPPTLGELMMMSQRRSYLRKAMEMHTQSFKKETKKRKAFRCCINRLMDILRKRHMQWTRRHQLKLK